METTLFTAIGAADVVVIDGYELTEISYPEPDVLRCSYDDLDWHFKDQPVELGPDGEFNAECFDPDIGGTDVHIALQVTRPLQVGDLPKPKSAQGPKAAVKKPLVYVLYGQDTSAYADTVIEVPADATLEQITEAAKAVDTGDLVFKPSYDWAGLRIVEMTEVATGTVLANDVPIEISGEDLGLVAVNVLSGATGIMALVHEAERQGIAVAPGVLAALQQAQAMLSGAAHKEPAADEEHRPISFSGGQKSISDDDLCASCVYCGYNPGELSTCDKGWPGKENQDGYVVNCDAIW